MSRQKIDVFIKISRQKIGNFVKMSTQKIRITYYTFSILNRQYLFIFFFILFYMFKSLFRRVFYSADVYVVQEVVQFHAYGNFIFALCNRIAVISRICIYMLCLYDE